MSWFIYHMYSVHAHSTFMSKRVNIFKLPLTPITSGSCTTFVWNKTHVGCSQINDKSIIRYSHRYFMYNIHDFMWTKFDLGIRYKLSHFLIRLLWKKMKTTRFYVHLLGWLYLSSSCYFMKFSMISCDLLMLKACSRDENRTAWSKQKQQGSIEHG